MAITPTILDVQEVRHESNLFVVFFETINMQIDFPPDVAYPGDWIRDEVSFLIGPVFTLSSALQVQPHSGAPMRYQSSSVLALPATFEVLASRSPELGLTGWGVDSARTDFDPSATQVRVTANVVAKAPASYFDRLRFLVIISGSFQ